MVATTGSNRHDSSRFSIRQDSSVDLACACVSSEACCSSEASGPGEASVSCGSSETCAHDIAYVGLTSQCCVHSSCYMSQTNSLCHIRKMALACEASVSSGSSETGIARSSSEACSAPANILSMITCILRFYCLNFLYIA